MDCFVRNVHNPNCVKRNSPEWIEMACKRDANDSHILNRLQIKKNQKCLRIDGQLFINKLNRTRAACISVRRRLELDIQTGML